MWRSALSEIDRTENNPVIEKYRKNDKLMSAWHSCLKLLRKQVRALQVKVEFDHDEDLNQMPCTSTLVNTDAESLRSHSTGAAIATTSTRLIQNIKKEDVASSNGQRSIAVNRVTRSNTRKLATLTNSDSASLPSSNVSIAIATASTQLIQNIENEHGRRLIAVNRVTRSTKRKLATTLNSSLSTTNLPESGKAATKTTRRLANAKSTMIKNTKNIGVGCDRSDIMKRVRQSTPTKLVNHSRNVTETTRLHEVNKQLTAAGSTRVTLCAKRKLTKSTNPTATMS